MLVYWRVCFKTKDTLPPKKKESAKFTPTNASILVGKLMDLYVIWDVHLPSNSQHKDYYIFSRGSLYKHIKPFIWFICHHHLERMPLATWEGGNTQLISGPFRLILLLVELFFCFIWIFLVFSMKSRPRHVVQLNWRFSHNFLAIFLLGKLKGFQPLETSTNAAHWGDSYKNCLRRMGSLGDTDGDRI